MKGGENMKKQADGLLVTGAVTSTVAHVLLVLMVIRAGNTRLAWFFDPVEAINIPVSWVLVALVTLALVLFAAYAVIVYILARKS